MENRKKILAKKDRYQRAEKTYSMILGLLNPSQWEKGKRETEREYIKQLEDLRNKYRRIDILIRKEAM